MPPRTKKRSSRAAIAKKVDRGGPIHEQAESDLPTAAADVTTVADLSTDVIEFILSFLQRRDNIRASAVSRRWFAAAVSARRAATTPPWLIAHPRSGTSYEFYDSSDRKSRSFIIRQMLDTRFIHARKCWLLLETPSGVRFFMFCPFTRKRVTVPKLPLSYGIAAFSDAPTSPDCFVFALSHQSPNNDISICTWQPGQTKWVVSSHSLQRKFPLGYWSQVVFSNGCFYCLSLSGQLGVFEIGSRTWSLLQNTPRELLEENLMRWKAKFLAELDGSLYIVCVRASSAQRIYRVHVESEIWEEVKSLGNVTIFANYFSSLARVDLGPRLAGRVIFSKDIDHGINVYPPGHYIRMMDPFYKRYRKESKDRIWIEAPGS